METSSRFFNASLRKSLKVLKSYPGGRSNRRFRERKRRETTPHRRAGRARQRSGRANGGSGIEYVLILLQFESGLNRGFVIFGRQYDAFGRDNLPERGFGPIHMPGGHKHTQSRFITYDSLGVNRT